MKKPTLSTALEATGSIPRNGRSTQTQLQAELAETRARLAEAEETLRAIRNGEVDGLIIPGAGGDQVFSLKGAEQPYRILIERMSDGAATLSSEGLVLYANQRMAEMLEHKLESLLGMPFTDCVIAADRPRVAKLLLAAETGRSGGEIRTRTAGGKPIPWHLSISRLPADAAGDYCVVATDLTELNAATEELRKAHAELEDRVAERTATLARTVEDLEAVRSRLLDEIRERTKASEALHVSEQHYHSLVEQLLQCVFRLDAEGRVIFANSHYCQQAGLPLGIILGRTESDLFPTPMGVKTESINENVIRSGVVYDEVERRVSPEGGDRYVQMVRAPLRNGAGSIIGILGICWDVTERRRLEGQMRVLVRAVEQSPASIVLTDTSGNIEFVNPKFTRVTGYTAAEVLGKQTRLLKSDETPVRTYDELWRTITSGKEWHGEFRNKRKDGTLFWEMASISPIRNSAGEITHYMAVKEYVTELKMTQAKFLRAQRLESIGSLASGIAHDLNNILAPIIMSAPMLAEEDSREVRQEIVKTIENCGQRAVSIVRQLLGFARGKDGHKQAVQVRHLVREMFKVARETFPRNISVTDSCANDLWIVAADATQIHQVLLNLSVNARDAMPQGGRLTFGASNVTLDEQYVSAFPAVRPGRYVRLEVADTGTGIPDQVKEHIFETFFTTKGEGEGTGLGLTTVQGIVEEHGGFMGFTSESGQGTTFTVHLPAMMDDATMAAEGAPESHSAPRGRGEWVLLVDDEPTIQETTRRTLERHGYHVVEARNGVEGLAEFSRHQHEVRVVITDCGMPVMDGVTMTRALRAIMPHLPILVSSGGSFTPTGGETLQAIKEIGGIRVLQKPHTAEALLQTLSEMLNPAHFTGQSAIHERTVPK